MKYSLIRSQGGYSTVLDTGSDNALTTRQLGCRTALKEYNGIKAQSSLAYMTVIENGYEIHFYTTSESNKNVIRYKVVVETAYERYSFLNDDTIEMPMAQVVEALRKAA